MTEHKPSLWLRYVDDTFIVRPCGLQKVQDFLHHLNSSKTSTQFTMETESENRLPFLDVLVVRNRLTLTTKVYRKPAHMGHYLNFELNHPPYVKRGIF